jgi:hypothetical protein
VLAPFENRTLHEIALDAASEPVDVGRLDDLVYVVFANKAEVEVWDVGAVPTLQATIDLSQFDADGNPNATSVAVLNTREGKRAVVSLAVTDEVTGEARGPALIVAIDIDTNEIIRSFETTGTRPSSLLEITGNASEDLVIATRDGSNGEQGCIEHVVLGETVPRLGSCFATNAALGGYARSVVSAGPGGGHWAVVETGPTESKLVLIDREQTISAPVNAADALVGDVAACGLTKFVVYTDTVTGTVRVYDRVLDITLHGEDGISIGLPPVPSGAFSCRAAL